MKSKSKKIKEIKVPTIFSDIWIIDLPDFKKIKEISNKIKAKLKKKKF